MEITSQDLVRIMEIFDRFSYPDGRENATREQHVLRMKYGASAHCLDLGRGQINVHWIDEYQGAAGTLRKSSDGRWNGGTLLQALEDIFL